MHEVFLCRLAAHPVFRNDPNFRIFLKYEQDVKIFENIWRILSFSSTNDPFSAQKNLESFQLSSKNLVSFDVNLMKILL